MSWRLCPPPDCHSFFTLLTPQPPTSTLFPYTTLFRSDGLPPYGRRIRSRRDHRSVPHRAARAQSGMRTSCSDRKSTRLNSSHTVISYAVFCLKKKKNNELT